MTISVAALTANPMDVEEGLYVSNSGGMSGYNFKDIGWTDGRSTSESVSSFGIIQVVGDNGYVAKIVDDEKVFDPVLAGDYIAYDSYVAWHIPAADLAGQDVVIDGVIDTVNIESLMD